MRVSIGAVGDIMLGDHPVRIGHGVRSTIRKNGNDFLFAEFPNFLKEYDIVFGNLEVVHSDIGLIPSKIESAEFRGSPESLSILSDAGFNVLGVANNHCVEHGITCFKDMIQNLTRNKIFPLGIKSDDYICFPYLKNINGIRTLLLSYSLRPENYLKREDVPYSKISETELLDEVAKFKNLADFVIISLHWGEEFMDFPSPSQICLAHKLIDNGVNLILGHHPHVLQGIEKYKHGIIAYSLGNFVFDMWQKKTRETMFLSVHFSDGIIEFERFPFFISEKYQPIFLIGKDKDVAIKKFNKLDNKIFEKYGNFNLLNKEVFDKEEAKYQKLAKRATLIHRLGNYVFFIMNIYKYNITIIWQSFKRSFMRRISEMKL